MKQQQPESFELFYQEMPQSDYLDDIDIVDEFEESVCDSVQGLSEEQVSEIAKDSLERDCKFGPEQKSLPENQSITAKNRP